MKTREEKLFVSMQQRLQQAALNDRERRTLLAQLESRMESRKVLVKFFAYIKSPCCSDIVCFVGIERYLCYPICSSTVSSTTVDPSKLNHNRITTVVKNYFTALGCIQ